MAATRPRAKAEKADKPRTSRRSVDRASKPDGLRSTVQSLAKGFKILEAFTTENYEMTLSEIAAEAALDPGTTFRMLNTLVDLGYVARVPDSRRFALTLKTLDLGFHAIARKDLRAVVRPVLRALVNDVNEAASFAILNGAEALYIERVRAGIARLGVDIRIGTTVPAHQSVIGHSILAFLPPAHLERLAAIPPRETLSAIQRIGWDDIGPSLAAIRRDGYALRDSTLSEGLRILAVPVLDPDNLAIGAISIAAPAGRISSEDFRSRALDPLCAAARISHGRWRPAAASATVFSRWTVRRSRRDRLRRECQTRRCSEQMSRSRKTSRQRQAVEGNVCSIRRCRRRGH